MSFGREELDVSACEGIVTTRQGRTWGSQNSLRGRVMLARK